MENGEWRYPAVPDYSIRAMRVPQFSIFHSQFSIIHERVRKRKNENRTAKSDFRLHERCSQPKRFPGGDHAEGPVSYTHLFKLEFGKTADGKIVLADEISPDTCRLWDKTTKEKLDKDRFRRDMGGVEEAYQEIMKRVMGK